MATEPGSAREWAAYRASIGLLQVHKGGGERRVLVRRQSLTKVSDERLERQGGRSRSMGRGHVVFAPASKRRGETDRRRGGVPPGAHTRAAPVASGPSVPGPPLSSKVPTGLSPHKERLASEGGLVWAGRRPRGRRRRGARGPGRAARPGACAEWGPRTPRPHAAGRPPGEPRRWGLGLGSPLQRWQPGCSLRSHRKMVAIF